MSDVYNKVEALKIAILDEAEDDYRSQQDLVYELRQEAFQDKKAYKETVENLEQELHETKSRIDEEIDQLVEEEIEKRSVSAYHETARLANILENRTTDLRFAEQELQDTKCALDNANEQIDDNEDRIDELENEVNSLNDDLERAEEELVQTKAKMVEAVDRIAELESGPKYYLREKIETLQNLIREQQKQIPSKGVQENHERNLRYCDAVTLWAGTWSKRMLLNWDKEEVKQVVQRMYDAHHTVGGTYPWEDECTY